MKTMILSLMLFGFCAVAANADTSNSFPVQTKIQPGTIEGLYDVKTGIQSYLGIPFAKPPVGNLRWKAPQPLAKWKGVKETRVFGPRPMQGIVFGDMRSLSEGISEDCLYLNVWTPAKRDTQGLPVLVYFYGGGFVAGDGAEPRYHGASMAQKGIIAVTVNYRLNVFGFLAHPELSAETSYKGSGNYGLLDQAMALQWVHDNIAAFGGDPRKITIAGESAGSISVSYQMVSPLAKHLLAGAVGQSGAAIPPNMAPVSLQEAEKTGAEFVQNAGYKSIKELRKLPARDIYEIYGEAKRFGFPLVIDGYFLEKSPIESFRAGEQAQVPLMAGWTSAEIPGMAFMQGRAYTPENFRARVEETYPEDAAEVLSLFAHASDEEVEYSATALASDRFIAYNTWKWLELHREHSKAPVYRFLFSKMRPPLVDQSLTTGLAGGTLSATDAPPAPRVIGAPHAADIEYSMANLHLIHEFAWDADDYKTAQTFSNFLANFVKTGNPNGSDLPEWPALKAGEKTATYMNIDAESGAVSSTVEARYHFHDRHYGNQL